MYFKTFKKTVGISRNNTCKKYIFFVRTHAKCGWNLFKLSKRNSHATRSLGSHAKSIANIFSESLLHAAKH